MKTLTNEKPLIGFIGQGWIGRNYANDFEKRGFKVVRYGIEEAYKANKDAIATCDIVFIAVPTPTTPTGFDDHTVREVIKLVGKGKIAVIKSTIIPTRTKEIQKENPSIFVLHSPEFLSEATAEHDAAFPKRNIIGIPVSNPEYKKKAALVMSVLPIAPYSKICDSTDAEIIKYGRNTLGFARVIMANIFYDLTLAAGGNWAAVQEAMSADPDNGPTYMNPIHKSGRGAGGNCFIKDFAAFSRVYSELVNDPDGIELLRKFEEKNLSLLTSTQKDLNLLKGVYGAEILEKNNELDSKEEPLTSGTPVFA